MNPHIKEEWVATLRGNKFKQVEGALRRANNERCALGVLVDVFIKYHPRRAGWQIQQNGSYELVTHDGLSKWVHHENTGVLPKVVQVWADLDDVNPVVGDTDDDADGISGLNDSGISFKEIANKIEQTDL